MPEYYQQALDLFLNTDGPKYPAQFWRGRFDRLNAVPQLFVGDRLLIRLWLCRPALGVGLPVRLLRSPGSIVVCVKSSRGDPTAPVLAMAQSFVLVDSSPESDGSEEHYECLLDIPSGPNWEGLKKASVDIEIQHSGSSRWDSFGAEFEVAQEVFASGDIPPPPATPPYPPPADLVTNQQVDSLIDEKVSAQLPPAVENAVGNYPHLSNAVAETLPQDSQAVATISADDPSNPQNLTLHLGIPRGYKGSDGVISSVPPEAQAGTYTIPSGQTTGTITLPTPFLASSEYKLNASLIAPAGSQSALTVQISNKLPGSFSYELSDATPGGENWQIDWTAFGPVDGSSSEPGNSIPPATNETLGTVRLGPDLTWSQSYSDGSPVAGAQLQLTQKVVGGYFPLTFANSAPTSGKSRIRIQNIFAASGLTLPSVMEAFDAIGFSFTGTLCSAMSNTYSAQFKPRLFVETPGRGWISIDWSDTTIPPQGSYFWDNFGLNWIATWRTPSTQA